MNYKEGRKNNCAWAYLLHYEKLPRIYIFIGCKGRINTLFNISAMIFMGVDKNKCIRSRINIREKEVQSIGKGLIWEKIWTVSPFVISSFMNRLKYITYSSWSPLFEQSNSFDSIRLYSWSSGLARWLVSQSSVRSLQTTQNYAKLGFSFFRYFGRTSKSSRPRANNYP